jgi:hypothetical protein
MADVRGWLSGSINFPCASPARVQFLIIHDFIQPLEHLMSILLPYPTGIPGTYHSRGKAVHDSMLHKGAGGIGHPKRGEHVNHISNRV